MRSCPIFYDKDRNNTTNTLPEPSTNPPYDNSDDYDDDLPF
jgi:hypothetical protein